MVRNRECWAGGVRRPAAVAAAGSHRRRPLLPRRHPALPAAHDPADAVGAGGRQPRRPVPGHPPRRHRGLRGRVRVGDADLSDDVRVPEPTRRSVGVHLKPWGLVPLTGVPAAMLGLPVPVEAVWGASAKELADRLDSAASPRAMLDILEAALLARSWGRVAGSDWCATRAPGSSRARAGSPSRA